MSPYRIAYEGPTGYVFTNEPGDEYADPMEARAVALSKWDRFKIIRVIRFDDETE